MDRHRIKYWSEENNVVLFQLDIQVWEVFTMVKLKNETLSHRSDAVLYLFSKQSPNDPERLIAALLAFSVSEPVSDSVERISQGPLK